MARLRYDGLSTTLGAVLTSSGTSITFAAALTHSNGTAVPTLTGSDYIPLVILDGSGHLSEIVYLTAYTSGGTTGTISRGKEGTTGVAHSSGDRVIHGPTAAFLDDFRAVLVYASGAYPSRPPTGRAEYIGPTQPTDWVAGDTWIKATP